MTVQRQLISSRLVDLKWRSTSVPSRRLARSSGVFSSGTLNVLVLSRYSSCVSTVPYLELVLLLEGRLNHINFAEEVGSFLLDILNDLSVGLHYTSSS